MLKFSDSRNFSRTLAAIAVVTAPLLMALGSLVDPAWTDDTAEYLQEVAAGEGRYILAGVLWTIGSLLLVVGMLGVIRLMRGRRVTLGQIGAGLVMFGAIGMASGLAFNSFEVAMAGEDNREAMVALSDSLEDSAALIVYWVTFFFVGIVLGSILLAIALLRRRIVPIWSPILLILAIVLGFVGGESQIVSALSFVVLAAALVPLAQRMWTMRDDDWERWELPLESGAAPRERAPG